MKQTVTINYRGIELKVRGKYLAWEPAPNDGGYIDEIEIIHAGQDIFPLLEDTDAYHTIHGMAYKKFFFGKRMNALIGSIEEIGKPASYFIERDKV